jgi:DNA processing protein
MDIDELRVWLRLLLTPSVGRGQARQLLAVAGSPQALFEDVAAVAEAALLPGAGSALSAEPEDLAPQLQATQAWLAAGPDRYVWALGDVGYPPQLLDIDDPPLLLFAMGSLAGRWAAGDHLREAGLAMVGSRNPTPQGQLHAQRFARALAQQGLTIVSGLALGIDGAAHEGALAGGGQTVAVVGTGLDRVYPRRHLDLARRIVASGAIVSEFPLGTPPLNHHFPQRNRILAGLARATLVVEANLQSGSLITARLAAEQGKEVMAIPGSIDSPQSQGCHQLIVQGARLVGSVADVLEALGLLTLAAAGAVPQRSSSPSQELPVRPDRSEPPEAQVPETGLSPPLAALLPQLGFEALSFEDLQARCGWPAAELQAALLELELAGDLARLPGALFQRLVRA